MLGQAEYVCVLSFQTRKVVVSCLAQILLSLRTSLRSRCITRSRPGSSAVRSFSRCHIGIWGISKVAKSQIIAGLLEKISGDVRFLDHPVEGPDRYCGVVFQTPALSVVKRARQRCIRSSDAWPSHKGDGARRRPRSRVGKSGRLWRP